MSLIVFVSAEAQARFWAKVDKSGDCWLWKASLKPSGYGHFNVAGKSVRAHRLAYQLSIGPIPDGKMLCHSCDNPQCVNPAHLTPGTNSENQQDSLAKGRNAQKRKTHCLNGHAFTPENTLPASKPGGRACRACHNARTRQARAARRA